VSFDRHVTGIDDGLIRCSFIAGDQQGKPQQERPLV
jgi:hypothetical protein